ncbi:MAG TPA: STAS domain-containing protein [Kineosporiaceae bacterium]|nr:STAS domain-containing protein [Kineosporiaceae bacterium]
MPAPHTSLLHALPSANENVAMATFDAELVCTFANSPFSEITGLDPGEVTGRTWSALFPGLSASQQAVVEAVAASGTPVGAVDVTSTTPGRPGPPGRPDRRRWRLALHRVEGVPGVAGGRVLSVLGSLATGPAVLDRPTFRHRVADTLRESGGSSGVLLVDLGQPVRGGPGHSGLADRAAVLQGVVRTTDIVTLDVDDATGRSYLALLCPSLPAPWTVAAIGDRLRRAAQLTGGSSGMQPQVSVTVARQDDSPDSLLRRATSSLHTELHGALEAAPLRTTVREHAVAAGRAVVVGLAGEADLSTLRGLTRLLEAIVEDRPAALVVDAGHLAFCDVATARALLAAAGQAGQAGIQVGIAGMPSTMEKMITLGWSGSRLRRWTSVEVALASL